MDYTHFIAFGVGVTVGIVMLGLTSFCEDVDNDGSNDRRQSDDEHPDTESINFLEAAEHSIFFNRAAGDAGMWGLLDPNNKLVAVGHTLRGLVTRAKDKALLDAEANEKTEEVAP